MVSGSNSGFPGQWAAGTWRCPSAFFSRSGCAQPHFPWCPKVPGSFSRQLLAIADFKIQTSWPPNWLQIPSSAMDNIDLLFTPPKRKAGLPPLEGTSVLQVQHRSLQLQSSPGGDGKTEGLVSLPLLLTLGLRIYLKRCFARHTWWVWNPVKGTLSSVFPSHSTNLRIFFFWG